MLPVHWVECTRQKILGLRGPVCVWFTKTALPELTAEVPVAKVHPDGSFWALKTRITKPQVIIPLSGAHI